MAYNLPVDGELNWDVKLNESINDVQGRLLAAAIKLAGIADGATANSADATLLNRDNHTDGTVSKSFTATEKTKLAGVAAGATANDTDTNLKTRANHIGPQSADSIVDGTTNKAYTAAEKTKLASIDPSLISTVYVWRYTGGAWPTLPGSAPAGVVKVDAIGPTQPSSVPAWIGTSPSQIPASYTYALLT